MEEVEQQSTGLSHAEWKRQQVSDPLICSVSEPRKKRKGFMKRKVFYVVRVSSKTNIHRVERAWKDFVALKQSIELRFMGCVVPPLPPAGSKFKNKKKDAFLAKRMRGLEHFIQTIAEHPYFRNDRAFQSFISNKQPFDRAVAKKKDRVESEGVRRWMEALRAVPMMTNPMEQVRKYAKELDSIKESLRLLKRATHIQMEKLSMLATASVDLTVAFKAWSTNEYTTVKSLHGESFSPTSKAPNGQVVLNDQIDELTRMTSQYAAVLHEEYGAPQLEAVLQDAIRFELATVRSWESALQIASAKLKNHQKILDTLKDCELELQKLTNKQRQLPETSTQVSSQIARLQKRLPEIRLSLRHSEQETGHYQRGILTVEIQLYRESRALRAEQLAMNYSRYHLHGIESLHKAFDGSGVGYSLEDSSRIRKKGYLGRKYNSKRHMMQDDGSSLTSSSQLQSVQEGDFVFRRIPSTNRMFNADSKPEYDIHERSASAAENHSTLKATAAYKAKKNDELDLEEHEILSALRIDDDIWYATNKKGKSGIVFADYVQVRAKGFAESGAQENAGSSVLFPSRKLSAIKMPPPPPPMGPPRKLSSAKPPGLGEDDRAPVVTVSSRNDGAQPPEPPSWLRFMAQDQGDGNLDDEAKDEFRTSELGDSFRDNVGSSDDDYDDEEDYAPPNIVDRNKPPPVPPSFLKKFTNNAASKRVSQFFSKRATIKSAKYPPQSGPEDYVDSDDEDAPVARPPNPFGGGNAGLLGAIQGFNKNNLKVAKPAAKSKASGYSSSDSDSVGGGGGASSKRIPNRPMSPMEELKAKLAKNRKMISSVR